jgi:chromosome segregation ATPase
VDLVSDWEEAKARLDEQFAMGGFDTQQQDDDIRAALGEIERLKAHEEASAQFLAERDALRKEFERAEAEVERLREATNVMGAAAASLGARIQQLRPALVAAHSLLSLVRHRHRTTPWSDDLIADVDAVLVQANAALRGGGE